MIKTVTITNHLDESILIDMRSPELSGFFIKGITGLGPVKAVINTNEALSLDGAVYNSARLTSRNIIFNLGLVEKPTIEYSRRQSYKYFPLKKQIGVIIETDLRSYKTTGYVESNEPDIFSNSEDTSISLICPNPYFYSLDNQIVSFGHKEDAFNFPFSNESLTVSLIIFSNLITDLERSFIYGGDSSVGITMHIHVTGPVENLTVYNLRTLESISIDSDIVEALTGDGLDIGDDITITTIKGQKSVILTRDGEEFNILNAMGPDSIWFSLEKGDNIFYYTADSGSSNLIFTIEYQILYEGI